MQEKMVHIPTISCGHCVMTIKRELGNLDGVVAVEANAETKNATVKWNDPLVWEEVNKALHEIGFPPDE